MESSPRFVTLDTVMEIFAISRSQAYALVRAGDLPAIQVGGRGQWRVALSQVEAFIERKYQARDNASDLELAEEPAAQDPSPSGQIPDLARSRRTGGTAGWSPSPSPSPSMPSGPA